jgi:hypothetical protein
MQLKDFQANILMLLVEGWLLDLLESSMPSRRGAKNFFDSSTIILDHPIYLTLFTILYLLLSNSIFQ